MTTLISVKDLQKEYDNGFKALKGANLDIDDGEIIERLQTATDAFMAQKAVAFGPEQMRGIEK
ncbi:MAG: hypothetical protein AAFR13_10415, partial [Pseudomonadota bacterium]